MRRHALAVPLIPVVLVALACTALGCKSEAGKSEAGKSEAGKSEAGNAGIGNKLEFALSSGQTLSIVPTTCTVDAAGKGTLEADEGKFTLAFEAGLGKLKWTHSGGTLDVETTVMVTGKSLVFSGLTPEGAGFNGEVTCP